MPLKIVSEAQRTIRTQGYTYITDWICYDYTIC